MPEPELPAPAPAAPESAAPESAGLESAGLEPPALEPPAPEPAGPEFAGPAPKSPAAQPAAFLLSRRQTGPLPGDPPFLRLALSADDRTRLRGHRQSRCGRDLLLQLERGEPLRPGEWLLGEAGDPPVRVEAAPESLLLVRATEPLALLQAAYHLGNRHVALELRPGELRLLWDPVLAHLLEHRGLQLERREEPFLPEPGAYAEGHGHGHGQDHAHGQHAHPADPADHRHGHTLQHPPADQGMPRHGTAP